MERIPIGVVERHGDGYVGSCFEVGTSSFGRSVEEAFANLRAETWSQLDRDGGRPTLQDAEHVRQDERFAA